MKIREINKKVFFVINYNKIVYARIVHSKKSRLILDEM